MSAAIHCLDVRKRYRSTVALDGVSLEVQTGSVFGFLGPNGAGKSTLVKVLTGLVRRHEGQAQVLGGHPGSREVQRRVGYLPEQFRFPAWLTGRELLDFHGRLAGVPVETEALLDLVGVGSAGLRRIGEYSKGMQQRLGLAQALVGTPELVFLDEPTSALDPLGRLDVRDVLLHLRERGTTVFLNSHLLTEVERVCDRIAIIDRGTIVAQGATAEMLSKPVAQIRVGEVAPDRVSRFLGVLASEKQGAEAATFADGTLTVPLASPGQVPALVRALVDAGADVYEVGLVRQSLEEAFVRLIRDNRPDREQHPLTAPFTPHEGHR